jgi:UDP-N-acetylglucosamine 4,6-dehydratase/5-epimerase
VPKLPSMRLTDLAEGLYPGVSHRFVGIRPGEKLHEIMCPADDSHLTLEFPDHYVIQPTINFAESPDYTRNGLKETATSVASGFEYNSATNPHFLEPRQIRELVTIDQIEY